MDKKYRKADYIFFNGKVVTANEENQVASALAVSDNRILYVGDSPGAARFAVPETQQIDLKGKTMTPGFIDSHAHSALSGLCKTAFPDISPSVAPDQKNLYAIVETAAKDVKPGEWLILWGYDELRMKPPQHPCRAELDKRVPDNPLIVARCDGHAGVANTKALKLAGFLTEPAKKYGQNELGMTDGKLNGYLADSAYYDLWAAAEIDTDKLVSALEEESRVNLRAGITSTHDSGGFGRISNRGYMEALKQGRLKTRATIMSWSVLGKDHYLKEARMFRDLGFGSYIGDDRVKYGMMKLMIDGSSSAPGAAVTAEYTHDPENYGTLLLTQEEVDDFVYQLHCTGHQVTAHAVGDKAIDMWLSAIEKAQAAYPRKDPRHRIEHAGIMTDRLLDRMKKLGVIPIPNPAFLILNAERYHTFYGDRCEMMFPLKSYLENDIPCAFGSDNPIIPENPLYSIAGAMMRGTFDGKVVVGEDQKIGFLDAVRMHTYNCAYSTFDEDKLGSLEEGKLADLAIYDADLLVTPPEQLPAVECVLTMVDGEIVYRR